MKTPHWPLEGVKALVASGSFVVLHQRAALFFPTMEAAVAASSAVVAELQPEAFVQTIHQKWDVCDVYGVIHQALPAPGGYYLKLCVQEGTLVVVISLHPLQHPIRTNAGIVKPGKRKGKRK